MYAPVALDRAPLGTPLQLTHLTPDATTARRLSALGLRRGARVVVVQRIAAGGRIVAAAGGRVALDARVLAALEAVAVEDLIAPEAHANPLGVPTAETAA